MVAGLGGDPKGFIVNEEQCPQDRAEDGSMCHKEGDLGLFV